MTDEMRDTLIKYRNRFNYVYFSLFADKDSGAARLLAGMDKAAADGEMTDVVDNPSVVNMLNEFKRLKGE